MKSRFAHRDLGSWLLLAPFGLLFVVFTLYPLAQSAVLSLHQTFGPGTQRFIGLMNYQFLLSDPMFWKAARNTTVYTIGSVFIQLPLSLGLALLLNDPRLRARGFWRLVFFSPALVGGVFTAMMFTVLFDKRTGLINIALNELTTFLADGAAWFASSLGVVDADRAERWARTLSWNLDFAWLQDHIMMALIVASLWMWVGFNMIYFLAALQNVPKELTEASTLDGAGPFRRFTSITLPAIRPVAGFVVLLSIIGSFQLFELPWIMLNNAGGPDNRGLTIMGYLYQTGFETGDLGYASAIGWALAAFLILCAVLQRAASRREAAT